jgi:hypothetical protein
MPARDNFPASVARALRDRAGAFCSRPECRRLTVSPNRLYMDKVDVTGRAAHIAAASAGGPRFDASMTPQQRSSAENGIWLCADCADLIDKDNGRSFPVEVLQGWKRAAEEELLSAAQLRQRSTRPVWIDKLRTPHYINVPRVLHLVGSEAISEHSHEALQDGFPGRSIVEELVETRRALQLANITAVDVAAITRPAEQIVDGMVLSFRETCRTRNGANEDVADVTTFSFERSPLVYFDACGYRYINPYDPRWVTTNTAFGTMREGSVTLAGISIVKIIRHSEKQVICTPLVLGIPDVLGFFS